MTREYREWLRAEIDQARRARLQRARLEEADGSRRGYMADYYQTNRERIIERMRDRRRKDAA